MGLGCMPCDRNRGRAFLVKPGCQDILESLPDDVLKVRVHTDMRAQPAAKEKPIPFAQNMLRCYPDPACGKTIVGPSCWTISCAS